MRTEVFKADTIDKAAEQILSVLKEHRNTTRTVSTRSNVIYFDGWDGLGASAVLRAISRRLTTTSQARQGTTPPAGLEFDQVIHIDCSLWESRRALQRAVAEQLKLPNEVMGLFDKQDEEDDFAALAQGSRAELQEVVKEMYQHMQNRSFLVILHNGSGEDIDLATCCGFPLSGYSTSMVLWTFQGRFRIKPRNKVEEAMRSTVGATDTFISMAPHKQKEEEVWSYLVHEEAAEVVAACNESHDINVKPAQVVECFLYILELCCRGSHCLEYDLATHGANYWVCDSIIHHHQLQEGERDGWVGDDNSDVLWRTAHALQREMPLDMDHHQYLPSPHLPRFIRSKPYWTSPTCGFTQILDGLIHNGDMFQYSFGKQLSVLKLSKCTFDFQSPPFVCCHGLRFLWLDHCQGTSSVASTAGAGKEKDICRFFQGLWVLVMRYTDCDQILSAQMLDLMTQLQELSVMGAKDFDMGLLQGRLPNIRKLRVTKSSICSSCPGNHIFLDMDKMELLEFSGNDTWNPWNPMKPSGLGVSSSNSCLETVFLEECNQLKWMCFRGCTKLKNLFFRGEMDVRNLDVSGTAVKVLDFSAIESWGLQDEICLLNCEKLCAILWPSWLGDPGDKLKLLIDTTQSASTARYRKDGEQGDSIPAEQTPVAAPHEHGNRPTTDQSDWHISVRDARLLFSLESAYGDSRVAYVEVSSPARPTVTAGFINDEAIKCGKNKEQQVVTRRQQGQPNAAVYADADTMGGQLHQLANEGEDDAPVIMSMWPCPDPPSLPQKNRCYLYLQDRIWTKTPTGGEETCAIVVPQFVPASAKILHVHDSVSVTTIPAATIPSENPEWKNIEWCKIERCPELKSVFSNPMGYITGDTYSLEVFWVSQLLKACYICRWKESSTEFFRSFAHLILLHMDNCPRLIHALPLFREGDLARLEIIEIMWCSDLRVVFPLGTGLEGHYNVTADFPALKHIHLHELPSLHSICGVRMSSPNHKTVKVKMSAPNLETVKIRGCWSLTRLPDISGGNKVVVCDCEKEWWERLEWDNSSQADHYKPIHSRYYKKMTLLKGSVLR